ncbi:hypothetical protein [Silvibacterium acidisoli]|uniref:hypothetical protein n=1 Tax=Acidobacteriaceae bacterium ZG23-2 TaxID=2883246 RepID=UPI00406BEF2A
MALYEIHMPEKPGALKVEADSVTYGEHNIVLKDHEDKIVLVLYTQPGAYLVRMDSKKSAEPVEAAA